LTLSKAEGAVGAVSKGDSDNLPGSWAWVQLKDIADIITGSTPPTALAENYGGDIPFIKPPDLRDGPIETSQDKLTELGSRRSRVVPAEAVLVSCIGNLGKTGITVRESAFNQQINAVVFASGIEPKYGFFACRTIRPFLEEVASATTVTIVNKSKFSHAPIPIAPLPEQHRIVAEIEKQFTRLDASVASLRRAQANLKRYRASVLKAACEGKLVPTEAELAHQEGRGYEPASVLLERILKERRARWEAQEKRRGQYKEPTAPDTSSLPQLPEGWVWATVDCFLSGIEAGKNFKCIEHPPSAQEVGVVKVSSVTWGTFNETESKTCPNDIHVNSGMFIREGDFLFSRANTIQLVGACVIARDVTKRLMLSDKILRLKTIGLPTEWLLYVLRSSWGRFEIERLATGNQESMRNIGQDRIRQIRVPLSPLEELGRSVGEVERHLSVIQAAENIVGGQPETGGAAAPEHPQAGFLRQAGAPGPQ
jgi:type I restriction enzyme S subunit